MAKNQEEDHDPLPALVAEIDQMLMMVPYLARWARALFEGFREEGFTDEQALELTKNQITRA